MSSTTFFFFSGRLHITVWWERSSVPDYLVSSICIFVNKSANLLFKTVRLGYLMSLNIIENLYVISFEQVFPYTHISSAAQNGVFY